jgi:hypothetical protein
VLLVRRLPIGHLKRPVARQREYVLKPLYLGDSMCERPLELSSGNPQIPKNNSILLRRIRNGGVLALDGRHKHKNVEQIALPHASEVHGVSNVIQQPKRISAKIHSAHGASRAPTSSEMTTNNEKTESPTILLVDDNERALRGHYAPTRNSHV